MKTKKKDSQLPENFEELVEAGDITALKAVFDNCEPDARLEHFGCTALHFESIPEEFARWLLERSADANALDEDGNTPLYQCSNVKIASLLFDFGAKINAPNNDGSMPLHNAAELLRVDMVRFLTERGADIYEGDNIGQTPLAAAFSRCFIEEIPDTAEIAALLLNAGAEITSYMKSCVKSVGTALEQYRENFPPDIIEKAEAGMKKLYSLFLV